MGMVELSHPPPAPAQMLTHLELLSWPTANTAQAGSKEVTLWNVPLPYTPLGQGGRGWCGCGLLFVVLVC